MKEIKAYIKCSRVERVVPGLEEIGVENMTVIDVMALGKGMVGYDQHQYPIEVMNRYSDVAKLEIICVEKDVDDIIEVIRSCSYSGKRGDGVIFVSDVSQAIKIRTGETGEGFLQPERNKV